MFTSEQQQKKTTTPQIVRWGPSDDHSAGIRVWNEDGDTESFIPWAALKEELERLLLPQMFADPRGYIVGTQEFHGKRDWLVRVYDKDEQPYCSVWFGNDPENSWRFDGMVRIGDADKKSHVWQIYQRYSDGTYRRLSSIAPSVETVVKKE